MDRFIVFYLPTKTSGSLFLKSNMDRFIALILQVLILHHLFLKSNMDRFIENMIKGKPGEWYLLKSNMDRFIGATQRNKFKVKSLFKIQYGQIYRIDCGEIKKKTPILKSNMDRFIVENIQIPFVLQMLLKSNMDRFIDVILNTCLSSISFFKIQYGQIYSLQQPSRRIVLYIFKIQYGQIYSRQQR